MGQKDVTNILAYKIIAGHLTSVSFTFRCLLVVSPKVNEAMIIRIYIKRTFKLEPFFFLFTKGALEGQLLGWLHIYIGDSIISYLQSSWTLRRFGI